ncbi:hypothetical protein EB052_00510, partial [bacterium]|nr:hypothetical protein [bacterium]
AKNGNAKIGVTASSTPAFATLGSFILSKNGVPMTSIPSNFRPTLTITPSESSSFVRSSGGDSYVLYGDSSGMVNLSLSFIVQGNPSNDAYAVRFAGPVSWTAGTTTAATSSYPTGAGWTTSAIIAP